MVRVLLLALAASAMSLNALPAAAARPHKPAPAASHKKPEPKSHAKGRGDSASKASTHGKGRHADEGKTPAKHGRGKTAHGDEDSNSSGDDCAPAKPSHGRHAAHGRKTAHACTTVESGHGHAAKGSRAADEDCTEAPSRSKRGKRAAHGRKPKHACTRAEEDSRDHGGRGGKIEEEDCVEVAVKSAHDKSAHGRRGHAKTALKCTRRMVSARQLDEPPPGPPPPPPLVVAAPGSPADIVKHSGPAPGVVTTTNPEVWAQRDQAQHRPRLSASPHLTGAGLIGRSDEDIRRTLGVPDLARNEGDGALWTYRLPACSLMVFLKRTDGAMKVSGAQSAPLQRSGSPIAVDACLAASAGR